MQKIDIYDNNDSLIRISITNNLSQMQQKTGTLSYIKGGYSNNFSQLVLVHMRRCLLLIPEGEYKQNFINYDKFTSTNTVANLDDIGFALFKP